MIVAMVNIWPVRVVVGYRIMVMPMTVITVVRVFFMRMRMVLVIVSMRVVMVKSFMDMIVAMLVAKEDEDGNYEKQGGTNLNPGKALA